MITKTGWAYFGLVGALAAALSAQACRSKLDVKSKEGAKDPAVDTPPEPEPDPVVDPKPEPPAPVKPVEKKDALALKGGKVYFQTRDTITIEIKKEVIEGAPSFTVLNITNSGNDDTKAVKIVEEQTPSFGLYGGFGLAEVSGGKVQLQFYPGDPQWKGKFFYGRYTDGNGKSHVKPNRIKVVANDEDNPRYSIIELYLSDFEIFDVAMTSFATNVQVAKVDGPAGYQFQGWLNVLSSPTTGATVTASDGSKLTTGMFNMMNPQ